MFAQVLSYASVLGVQILAAPDQKELVAGFITEYTGMSFGLFFLGEYLAVLLVSALAVTLFFGGWTLPILGLDQPAESWWVGLIHIGIFMAKMLTFMGIFIWVRWMLPRFRYDQLMHFAWGWMFPDSIGLLFLIGLLVVVWT